MRPAFRCGILAFALAVLAGCGQREDGGAGQAQAALAKPSASAAAEPAVARLGALQVAPDELKALLAEVPAETRAQLSENRDALERWMRARLAEKALYEQASAQDWQQRPQVKTLIDAAARQIVLRTYLESVSTVPEDYPSDAELQAAYQANKAQLAVPALYRVSQIFIAASAAGGLAEARKRAQELYRQAADGDFAELARKHSDDPQTARNGGDIGGLLAQAQLLPAIRPALERLKVGAVSEPIQGANGFHLVKLTERRDARLATLDEVRGRLRESLRAQRQEQIAKAYLDGLVNNAAGNFIAQTEKMSPRGFDAIANIVFHGSFYVTQACGKRWVPAGHKASVISIVTSWVWTGSAFVVPSATSFPASRIATLS